MPLWRANSEPCWAIPDGLSTQRSLAAGLVMHRMSRSILLAATMALSAGCVAPKDPRFVIGVAALSGDTDVLATGPGNEYDDDRLRLTWERLRDHGSNEETGLAPYFFAELGGSADAPDSSSLDVEFGAVLGRSRSGNRTEPTSPDGRFFSSSRYALRYVGRESEQVFFDSGSLAGGFASEASLWAVMLQWRWRLDVNVMSFAHRRFGHVETGPYLGLSAGFGLGSSDVTGGGADFDPGGSISLWALGGEAGWEIATESLSFYAGLRAEALGVDEGESAGGYVYGPPPALDGAQPMSVLFELGTSWRF
jgi:hypothetical protein